MKLQETSGRKYICGGGCKMNGHQLRNPVFAGVTVGWYVPGYLTKQESEHDQQNQTKVIHSRKETLVLTMSQHTRAHVTRSTEKTRDT